MSFTRRTLLKHGLALGFGQAALAGRLSAQPRGGEPDFSAVNGIMEQLIARFHIAGASLGIFYRGKRVLSRGYGLADVARRRPVEPSTYFSTASVSKPITGVGILKLVEQGKLSLDTRVMSLLGDLHPLPGQRLAHPRFRKITVHHLLFHGGGFPHDARLPGKVNPEDGTESEEQVPLQYRWLLGQPLKFDPGTQHAYSNAGFVVLRLVVERVAGQEYESFIKQHVLKPMGITRMRLEEPGNYRPDETHRYKVGGRQPAVRNVANWLATGTSLARFAAAVAGSGGPPFLGEKVTALMLESPPSLHLRPGPHVGLGWDTVQQTPRGYRFSKNGGKPGVQAWLEHLPSGIDFAFLFNTSAPKEGPKPMGEARKLLYAAFESSLAGKR
jgi:N-acyl-D-amino-acid deacylase